jgi:hypothetical protein
MHLRKTYLIFWIYCITIIFIHQSAIAQIDSCKVVIDDVSIALYNGDANRISNFFNTKIELALPGQTAINSRNQATMILNSFFEKNRPTSFYNISKSYSNQGVFIVGTLLTEGQRYRVSYLVKSSNKSNLIYQLSIEK